MKKATIITLIAAAALVAGYLCFFGVTREKYDSPPNTIGKIKYFEPVHKTDAYRPPTLTPVGYRRTPFSQSVTAKAIYKGETIGLIPPLCEQDRTAQHRCGERPVRAGIGGTL